MSFHWQYELATDSQATPDDLAEAGFLAEFGSQSEAEGWLGEHYLDLQDYGVASVTLLDTNAVVYGPMGLGDA